MPHSSSPRKKVLAYLFGSLGDTLVAIPALRAVKRHFGSAEIVLLQNNSLGGAVQASEVVPNDLVDRYLSYEAGTDRFSRIGEYFRLWRTVRSERFDAVVYLVISERAPKSVIRDKRFFRWCGIGEMIGFHSFSAAELYPTDESGHPASTEHEAIRKLHRIEMDGLAVDRRNDLRQPTISVNDDKVKLMRQWIADNRRNSRSKLVALAPGCKTKANQWPIERFEQLGRYLIDELDREIIVVGGPAEKDDGEKLIRSWGSGMNAAGIFSVIEMAALLAQCDEYLGLDTGTTHLAAAVNLPCFAIYGEKNNPGHWYPLGDDHIVIWHRVACAGCRYSDCPVDDHPCITGISVDNVWEQYKEYSQRIANSRGQAVTVIEV